MGKDQLADQYYMSLKSMYLNSVISEADYLRLQRIVIQWADKPTEAEAFGNDCPNGICEV